MNTTQIAHLFANNKNTLDVSALKNKYIAYKDNLRNNKNGNQLNIN